jgi:hypothetical protein
MTLNQMTETLDGATRLFPIIGDPIRFVARALRSRRSTRWRAFGRRSLQLSRGCLGPSIAAVAEAVVEGDRQYQRA